MWVVVVVSLTFLYILCRLLVTQYGSVYPGYRQKWTLFRLITRDRLTNIICNFGESMGVGSYVDLVMTIAPYFSWICPERGVKAGKEAVKTVDDVFDGIPVRIYRPEFRMNDAPAIVFFHGGGWVFCSIDSYDDVVMSLSQATDAVVISVGYRMAPKYKFPIPLDDCAKVAEYVMNNYRQLDLDQRRIAIAGDSAGANLAAAVCLKMKRITTTPMPCAQILLYPVLQPFNFNTPSYQQHNLDPLLSKRSTVRFWALYAEGHCRNMNTYQTNQHVPLEILTKLSSDYLNVDNLPDNLKYPPYKPSSAVKADEKVWKAIRSVFMDPLLSPLIADDLTGLPSAYIVTAQHDVLRDDGFLYARRLQQAGVKVTHDHLDNGFHDSGFYYGASLGEQVPELRDMQRREFCGIRDILSKSQ